MVEVHGKVIAGGVMLVWPFDIVIASEDATFQDNTVAMGICGAEFFNASGGGRPQPCGPMLRGGPRDAGRGLLGACAVEVSRQRNFQRDRQVALGACAVEVSRQRNFQRDRQVALGACAVEVSRQRNFQRDRQVALGPRQKFRWTSTPMTRGLPHAPNFPPLNAPEL